MNPLTDPQIHSFWNATPFPHLVIDNFLPLDEYNSLIKSLLQESGKKGEQSFNTSIEKNKETHANTGLNPHLNNLVSKLTSPEFKMELRRLTGVGIIRDLTEFPNNVFRYHHTMSNGGFLGSHVDHSYLEEALKMVHFLNCIFYAPEVWSHGWGGHTSLFNEFGNKELARVGCCGNRLLIFLHTSKSFHGVGKINGSHCYKRHSVYMDYYTHVDTLSYLTAKARENNSYYTPEFWKHGTTFLPGWTEFKYYPAYIKYLLKHSFE